MLQIRAHAALLNLAVACLVFSCTAPKSTTRADAADSDHPAPAPAMWLREQYTHTLISAHRAQPEADGYAENSLKSMQHLMDQGLFILELDVAKSQDGTLFLFHDDELDRLTVHRGAVTRRVWSDLDTMRLRDHNGKLTKQTPPTLAEALAAARGKALVSLDPKGGVSLQEIWEEVERAGMSTTVALILYDAADFAEWASLHALGPISYTAENALQVEQLAQESRELYARLGVSPFRSRESFPALVFAGVGPAKPQVLAKAEELNLKTLVATFGALDSAALVDKGETYRQLAAAGVSIIATNRPMAAHRALASRGGK